MKLKKKIEQLERWATLHAEKRKQEDTDNLSDSELHFYLVHGCSPEEVECGDEPHTRQFTCNGVRATITIERVK